MFNQIELVAAQTQTEDLVGTRLATSAQPPRTTSPFLPRGFLPTCATAHAIDRAP